MRPQLCAFFVVCVCPLLLHAGQWIKKICLVGGKSVKVSPIAVKEVKPTRQGNGRKIMCMPQTYFGGNSHFCEMCEI